VEHLQASTQGFKFFCPNLAKGAITHFYGLLKGFAQGRLKTLFSPQVGTPPHIMTTPPISFHKLITPIPFNLKEHGIGYGECG